MEADVVAAGSAADCDAVPKPATVPDVDSADVPDTDGCAESDCFTAVFLLFAVKFRAFSPPAPMTGRTAPHGKSTRTAGFCRAAADVFSEAAVPGGTLAAAEAGGFDEADVDSYASICSSKLCTIKSRR